MANVKQDKVVRCFDKIFLKRMRPPLLHKKSRGDNRGPDRVLERNGKRYYLEAIGWTEKPRGKNQSDFWKAFSQAIARLNKKSQWGQPDISVILLPFKFSNGWQDRVSQLGEEVWLRIGKAFPELEIWFVSNRKCYEFAWSRAFYAFQKKKEEV